MRDDRTDLAKKLGISDPTATKRHRANVLPEAPHVPLRTRSVSVARGDHFYRWRLWSPGRRGVWANGTLLRWHPAMLWAIGGRGGIWHRLHRQPVDRPLCPSHGCDKAVLIRVALDLDIVRWQNDPANRIEFHRQTGITL